MWALKVDGRHILKYSEYPIKTLSSIMLIKLPHLIHNYD